MNKDMKIKTLQVGIHAHYNRAENYKRILLNLVKESGKMDRYIPRTIDRFQEAVSDAVVEMAELEFGEEE